MHMHTRTCQPSCPRLPLWLASGALLLLAGCRSAAPPPAQPAPPAAAQPLPLPQWAWLTTDESEAVNALITLADQGPVAAEAVERQAFLKAYAAAFHELATAPPLPVLRRLWELESAARRARLSAGEVRRAVGLAQASAPPPVQDDGPGQPVGGARLMSLRTLDPAVRRLLQAGQYGGQPAADFLQRWVRRVVIVTDPAYLSSDLPLKCEGSVEVLSGTVFLTATDQITGQARPPWKVAAALVHEAEHIRWFYAVAGDDPRYLFKAPDERNSYLGMFTFVRDLRTTAAGRAAASVDAASLSEEMQKWRGYIGQANTLLGYPPDDLTRRKDLTASDEALRTDPVNASALSQSPAGEAGPGHAQ